MWQVRRCQGCRYRPDARRKAKAAGVFRRHEHRAVCRLTPLGIHPPWMIRAAPHRAFQRLCPSLLVRTRFPRLSRTHSRQTYGPHRIRRYRRTPDRQNFRLGIRSRRATPGSSRTQRRLAEARVLRRGHGERAGGGQVKLASAGLYDTPALGELTAAILFVRIKSGLDAEEFDRRLAERRPRFREVPGLMQKIYGRDDATGDVCGIYFFENKEALAAFRETELAQTIPAAYEAVEVRREAYDVLYPLWPERGPLSADP